ncbi:hypothetical protein SLS60_009880 [Paraconiothyrium brasiliense]|uniref:Bacteriophage T5 Orf172 DNA-binding domain-containing protein n=1 Tax=Paraconiothyrium brasiliense TaxID=300254 RepID=A0ABR3QSR1_9PLEO
MMRETSQALEKTEVSDNDFVTIDYYGGHLRQLWRNADPVTKINFKKAIAEGHKDIFKYYARLKGCHVDDVEDAIKSEEPVPEASNEFQVIVHEPNQHTLLSNIRELVGLQAMYSETQADGREPSNEADTATSGASGSAIFKPLHIDINAWEHRLDQPIDLDFQPRVPLASRSPEPGLVNSRASKNLTEYTVRSPDVAPLNSISKKSPGPAINPFSLPEVSETSKAGPPLHPTSSLVSLGNQSIEDGLEKAGVGRDTRGHTPGSMTSGSRSGESSAAQVSAENTPTPPAKKAGLFGMKTSMFPAQPPLTPTNPNQFSAHPERPMEAATPPTQRGLFSPDYTPRSGTPRHRRTQDIAYDIRELLRKPIDYDNSGYIYVMKASRFFDRFPPSRDRAEPEQWVKIGITQDIKERMDDLIKQCGMTDLAECGDDRLHKKPMLMPTLRRVEALCHKELENFKRPLDCNLTDTKCNTVHREWFNVTEEAAIRTVKRWLKFFDQSPYTKSGVLESGFWDDRVWNGEYLETDRDEDIDRTHERYQTWLESSIQQYETMIAEGKLNKLSV